MVNTEHALTIYNTTPEQASKILEFANSLKKKVKAKKKDEEDEEAEDAEEEDTETEASDEETEEADESEEESDDEDSEEEAEDEGPTLKEVMKAMSGYADKHDRPAAMKLLAQFKSKDGKVVKSTHKLKSSDYQKVIDLTKKKPAKK